ncbi:hypothetical protein BDZ45DRAFT_737334 [Acephala macrosclerotiorum]|nr:hypothetical protein BDZ45DRAFT_737334 [Acephala macrosclerotiorum]
MQNPKTIEWHDSDVYESPTYQPYARFPTDPQTGSSSSRQLQLEPYTSSRQASAGVYSASTNPRQLQLQLEQYSHSEAQALPYSDPSNPRHLQLDFYTPSGAPVNSHTVPLSLRQLRYEVQNFYERDLPCQDLVPDLRPIVYDHESPEIHAYNSAKPPRNYPYLLEPNEESPQSQAYNSLRPPRNYRTPQEPSRVQVREEGDINNPEERIALQSYITSERALTPYRVSSNYRANSASPRLRERIPTQALNPQVSRYYAQPQEQDQVEEETSVGRPKKSAAPQIYIHSEVLQDLGDSKRANAYADSDSCHSDKVRYDSDKDQKHHRSREDKDEAEPSKSKDKKYKEKPPKLSAKELEKQYKDLKDKERKQGTDKVLKYFASAPVERKKRH